jgi:hypothetical protein
VRVDMGRVVQGVEGVEAGEAPPRAKRGRPPMYEALFREIQRQFGPGVWVRAVMFSDKSSAKVALNCVKDGKRPVPGGPGEWELESCTEDVEMEGGGVVRGSALYVRWVPPGYRILPVTEMARYRGKKREEERDARRGGAGRRGPGGEPGPSRPSA